MQSVISALPGAIFGVLVGIFVGVVVERIRSREWKRKEQWKFKCDVYSRLLDGLMKYGTACEMLSQPSYQTQGPVLETKRTEAIIQILATFPLLSLFVSEAARTSVERFLQLRAEAENAPDAVTRLQQIANAIDTAEELLMRSAKNDLKF